jgi:hypothetical protein
MLKMSKILLLLICINLYKSTLAVFSIFFMFRTHWSLELPFKMEKKEFLKVYFPSYWPLELLSLFKIEKRFLKYKEEIKNSTFIVIQRKDIDISSLFYDCDRVPDAHPQGSETLDSDLYGI